jgi:hypothetical protein
MDRPAHAYQDVMIRTSSGRIILPVYSGFGQKRTSNDRAYPTAGKLLNGQFVGSAGHFWGSRLAGSFVCYSDDEGRTWKRNSDGELLIRMDAETLGSGLFCHTSEPTITETTPGRLLMIMRTGVGRHFQSWSHDDGATWTRPEPTQLAASTTPAQIRTLPMGHLLVVWNQESEAEVKMGYNRTRISSAVSRNGGTIWEFFQNVESIHEETRVVAGPIRHLFPAEYSFKPGEAGAPEWESEYIEPHERCVRWSYPSVLVMKDRVLIAHTYSVYKEHPTKATLIIDKFGEGITNQKLKVFPISWFYGGKEPADHPFLTVRDDRAEP